MRTKQIHLLMVLVGVCLATAQVQAVTLDFAGSQANLGGPFFPGGSLPYVTVPWRTSSENNIFATGDSYPDQFYGKDGYALFATTFTYPNANLLGGESNIDPVVGDPLFPNIIELPDWIEDSQPLATRMAGGYAYSLIDDPVLMDDGIRHWSFDGTNYPPATEENNTGQNPWVKMGFLDGNDILGNNPAEEPTGRWGFTVGSDVPEAFRVGVMTGGMDNGNFAPVEVFLQQFEDLNPVGDPLGSGELTGELRDRFVDMHFFDIIGAEEGESFVFGAMAGEDSFGIAGVAGFSFDVLPEAPVESADFDEDGDVDGKDFLAWQAGFGTSGGASLADGDANGDGNVDGADRALWEMQFGTMGSPLSAVTQVPEPATLLLLFTGGLAIWLRRN